MQSWTVLFLLSLNGCFLFLWLFMLSLQILVPVEPHRHRWMVQPSFHLFESQQVLESCHLKPTRRCCLLQRSHGNCFWHTGDHKCWKGESSSKWLGLPPGTRDSVLEMGLLELIFTWVKEQLPDGAFRGYWLKSLVQKIKLTAFLFDFLQDLLISQLMNIYGCWSGNVIEPFWKKWNKWMIHPCRVIEWTESQGRV